MIISPILITLISLLAQSPPPAAALTARVEGTVISSTTGDPLKKAVIELQSIVVNRVSSAGNYISTTDAQGKFLFEEVQPGTYALHAERVGYVSQKVLTSGTVSTLKLVAGQKVADLAIKLAPQGAIYGRITDEDGDPVRNSDIDLLHWTYENGKKELRSINNSGLSVNDDGTFIIGYLPPGRYYAKATHGIRRNAEPGRKGEPQDWYVPTYFPSAIDSAGAAPIDIQPGVEVRGVEIRLRKTRVFSLRGKANVNLPGAVQNLIVRLTLKDGVAGASKALGNDASFEFANLLLGIYVLEAITTSITTLTDRVTGEITRTPPMAGRTLVTIADANVEGVILNVNSGAEITGRLKTESPLPLPPTLRVRLERPPIPHDSDQYKADGTFRIRGIPPDEYRVRVLELAEGVYVKLVKFGDQDITRKKLDLSTGASGELEITLSPNAAEVTGVVRNEKGDAAADVTVQITRDGEDVPIPTVSTDQNGAFHLRGLAPGEYRVFAWQDDGDGIILDPEFRKRFGGTSAKIMLAEKSSETIEARLISKESMEAEMAKMPQ